MVDHLYFSCGKYVSMPCSLAKVLGVTNQLTNKLLERPGAEAQKTSRVSDLPDRRRSYQARLVVVDHLVAEPQFVIADDERPGAG